MISIRSETIPTEARTCVKKGFSPKSRMYLLVNRLVSTVNLTSFFRTLFWKKIPFVSFCLLVSWNDQIAVSYDPTQR